MSATEPPAIAVFMWPLSLLALLALGGPRGCRSMRIPVDRDMTTAGARIAKAIQVFGFRPARYADKEDTRARAARLTSPVESEIGWHLITFAY